MAEPLNRPRNVRVVIITGLSGSGKSTALRALEDAGFFAVDNLPVDLLPYFLELKEQASGEVSKVALVMDHREPNCLDHYPAVFKGLKAAGFRLEIVFLEASTASLLRRFSQTRRAHPLEEKGPVAEAIAKEREVLGGLKTRADMVLDTTRLSVHELKTRMVETFSSPLNERRMLVTLVSFGFKYGLPREADMVMDVRFLTNPHFVEGLREKDGLSPEVVEFVNQRQETAHFQDRFFSLLEYLLPLYEKEGKAYLTIGLGCTGGRHRSVVMVDQLSKRLKESGYQSVVRHRDINLD
ncbi:MAG: RNase adapter RapZ [Deltaproteobacteria bacterium]|nr:RNase adapter RapZ [Deltaproteobacteria bacterium]